MNRLTPAKAAVVALSNANIIGPDDFLEAIRLINRAYTDNSIGIWTVEDVFGQFENLKESGEMSINGEVTIIPADKEMTHEEAHAILMDVGHRWSAEIGINWDLIDECIGDYYGKHGF